MFASFPSRASSSLTTAVACGGWVSKAKIPEGQSETDAFSRLTDNVASGIKGILEGNYPAGSSAGWITTKLTPSQTTADKDMFGQAQKAYSACINEASQERVGLEPLRNLVQLVATLYPDRRAGSKRTSYTQAERSASMGQTLAFFEQIGLPTFQTISPMSNSTNATVATFVTLMPASSVTLFWDPDGAPPAPDLVYIDIQSDLLSALHPGNISSEDARALMKDITAFENQVDRSASKAMYPDDFVAEKLVTLTELDEMAPHLNLSYAIRSVMPPTYKIEKIWLPSPDYFFNTTKELLNNQTDEVIQGYFIWQVASAMAAHVRSNITSRYTDYRAKRFGRRLHKLKKNGTLTSLSPSHHYASIRNSQLNENGTQPRWQVCLDTLNQGVPWYSAGLSTLNLILSRFFIDKFYPENTRTVTKQVLQEVQTTFLSRINSKPWVSGQVKQRAAAKLSSMSYFIGYPEILTDPLKVYTLANGLNMTASHFDNILSMAHNAVVRTWADIGEPQSNDTLIPILNPQIVNAENNRWANSITVLAGLEQWPLYIDGDIPSYLHFGGIGAILGHELTHSFDDNGWSFDAKGVYSEWWDKTTLPEFEQRAKCFIKQYNNFTVTAPNGTSVNVDGLQTLSENLADAGGLSAAFAAWKKEQASKEDQKLPGLENFSNEQLFFIKFAHTYCALTTPAQAVKLVKEDVHAPDFARILGTTANSRDFREAFQCPVKEPTCEVW